MKNTVLFVLWGSMLVPAGRVVSALRTPETTTGIAGLLARETVEKTRIKFSRLC